MTGRLAGKVAVVAGGSAGIGLAIAARFAEEGARVFLVGRTQVRLDAAVDALQGDITALRADMSVQREVDAVYATIRTLASRIDVLVANVGGGRRAPLGSIDEAHFDSVFRLNVKATLFTVQQALPLLPAQASVILVSSSAAHRGTAALSVYSAAKAAVRSFARCWALDLRARGVRVNVLSPGPTETSGLSAMVPPSHVPRMIAQFAARIPAGRIGTAADVANAALFLASDDSAFVNGAELAVDGGFAQI